MARWSTNNVPAHALRTDPGPDATVRVPFDPTSLAAQYIRILAAEQTCPHHRPSLDESATSSLLFLRFCELLATKVYFVVSCAVQCKCSSALLALSLCGLRNVPLRNRRFLWTATHCRVLASLMPG
ncbi:uncharacterized protein PHALS_03188 [Plasmopara halstedii]|uniref:Uncharacterized protein n=1 Tax=Plasmopara halstedii TaxID=4781 RepID=A0A0N7L7B2_PLAHL|nr:uncharacterized protein PHALS_03188 [Plasmopara halstedii]CEG46587.1 hypothetical protein PHALS_03188 [Plasmopara halstedii]|eukprot:XP_024582956.1 hypothetical protein PHALS_03188 [Plasmopara halstedii]